MEETEKEREERLKEWENFLEEGEGEEEEGGKGGGKGGGKDSTATSTHQSRGENKVCVLSFMTFELQLVFGCRKVVKAEKDILLCESL